MEQSAQVGRNAMFGALAFLFYVCVFFPYIQILPIGSDTQPNALLVGLLTIALASRNLRLPVEIWTLGLFALMAAAVYLLDYNSFAAVRSLFGYISLFVISTAAFVCKRYGFPLRARHLALFVFAWLILGLAQAFIDPDIGTAFLADARTTKGRGVVSFAVEPGFYGAMMFFVLLVLMAEKREVSTVGFLCVLQIVFLAQSSVTLVALLIPAAIYLLLKMNVLVKSPYFWGGPFVLLILSPSIFQYFEGSRIGALVSILAEDPELLIIADESGNQRAASIYISISGALDNYLVPQGFDAYLKYAQSVAWEFRSIFFSISESDRIMSGYGAALFELGIFGLILPVVITIAIFCHFGRDEWQRAVVMSAATHAIMFTAIPMALPAVGFLIGHLLASPAGRPTADRRPFDARSSHAPAPV